MKTLEQILSEYGLDIEYNPEFYEELKYSQKEYAREALRLASENASLIKESQYTGGLGLSGLLYEDTLVIDKQSILSENNLPKHK